MSQSKFKRFLAATLAAVMVPLSGFAGLGATTVMADEIESKMVATLPEKIKKGTVDLRGTFSTPDQGLANQDYNAHVLESNHNVLRLTDGEVGDVGDATYIYRIPLEEDWSMSGMMYLGDKTQKEGGGYGLTFMMHNDTRELDAGGNGGGGLGLGSWGQSQKVGKGLAIEFDTHLEYDENRGMLAKDFGQDYDVVNNILPGLTEDTHLLHTAIQSTSLGSNAVLYSNANTSPGIGNLNGVSAAKAYTWHKQASVITVDDSNASDIFGHWLDFDIEWNVEYGVHSLSYKLYDKNGKVIVNETASLEEIFQMQSVPGSTVMGALFDNSPQPPYKTKYVYWGFTASTGFINTDTPEADVNFNEHGIALTNLPITADATIVKGVRNVTKNEADFVEETMADIGDDVEYRLTVGLEDTSLYPLAITKIHDPIDISSLTLNESTLKVRVRDEEFPVKLGSAEKEEEYYRDLDVHYEPVPDPHYYVTKDGQLHIYALGNLGKYVDDNENAQTVPHDGLGGMDEETIVVTFQAKVVGSGDDGVITNDGYVTAGTLEDELSSNEVKVIIPPNVTITKQVDKKVATPGETLKYTIQVKNDGMTWTGDITDTLESNLTYAGNAVVSKWAADIEHEDGGTWIKNDAMTALLTEEDGTITLPGIELHANEDIRITFDVTVNQDITANEVKNTASYVGTGEHDGDDGDSEEVVTEIVKPGQLAVEKHIIKVNDNDKPLGSDNVDVFPDDEVTYKIIVRNINAPNTTVTNVGIYDQLPEGVAYVSGTIALGGKNSTVTVSDANVAENGKITVNGIGSLNGGEQYELTYSVKVSEEAFGKMVNSAGYVGTTIGVEDGEKKTITLSPEKDVFRTIQIKPDISVTKDADEIVYSGDNISYVIRLSNGPTGGYWKGSLTDTIDTDNLDVTGNVSVTVKKYDKNGNQVGTDSTVPVSLATGTFTIDNLSLKAGEYYLFTYQVKTASLTLDQAYAVVENNALARPDKEKPEDPQPEPDDEDDTITYVVPKPGDMEADKDVTNVDVAYADYSADKSIDGQKVQVGTPIKYWIAAKNPKAADTIVNNVKVEDEIPLGLKYVPGTFQINGQSVKDSDITVTEYQSGTKQIITYSTGRSLRGGQSLSVSFHVDVTTDAVGELENIATVGATVPTEPVIPGIPNPEEKPVTDGGTADNLTEPDVSVKKEVAQDQVYVEGQIDYTIRLTNAVGAAKWVGNLTDELPEGSTYVRGSTTLKIVDADNKVVKTISNPDSYWTDGQFDSGEITLTSGQSYLMTFSVLATEEKVNDFIYNTVYYQGTGETAPTPSEEVETKVVERPGILNVEKDVYTEDGLTNLENQEVALDQTILYQITVSNVSDRASSRLDNLVLYDEIPEQLTADLSSVTVKQGETEIDFVDVSDLPQLELILDEEFSLFSGESVVITFKATLNTELADEMINVATVTVTTPLDIEDEDYDGTQEGSDDVSVGPFLKPEIELTKSVNKSVVEKGETVVYTIHAVNKGKGLWIGGITDPVPDELINFSDAKVSGTGAYESVQWNNRTLTVTGVILEAGQALDISFEAEAGPNSDKTITNIAYMDGTDRRGNIYKDDDDVDITVISKPDVTLQKKVSSEKGKVGGTLVYTIAATNNTGAGIWKDGEIRDAVPEGTRLTGEPVQVTLPSGKTYTINTGSNDTEIVVPGLTLQPGETLQIEFKVVILQSAAGKEIVNVATGTGKDSSGNPWNPKDSNEVVTTVPLPNPPKTGMGNSEQILLVLIMLSGTGMTWMIRKRRILKK